MVFENTEDLKRSITNTVRTISPETLVAMRREFYDRLAHCLAAEGGLFEHLIKKRIKII